MHLQHIRNYKYKQRDNTLFPQAGFLFKHPDILESIKDKLFYFLWCCVEASQIENVVFVSMNKGMRC